ncbi:MAG: hypothetical protein M1356_05780 [Gammaproteobacteria bacterium]|nr:hypothetical protein [Gammaproteobacteria bacterium]
MQPSAISSQPADSPSQSFVVMIEHAPTNTELGLQALEQVRNLIAAQHRIEQVFFYAAGVLYANCFLEFPSGLPKPIVFSNSLLGCRTCNKNGYSYQSSTVSLLSFVRLSAASMELTHYRYRTETCKRGLRPAVSLNLSAH